MDTKQRGEMNWDIEIDVYTLLHSKYSKSIDIRIRLIRAGHKEYASE